MHLSNGQILNIEIKRSTRSKSIRLKANSYGIRVVAPTNYEVQDIISFIQSKRSWILKAYEYFGRFVDKIGQENNINEDSISFLGAMYKLQIVRDKIPSNVISNKLKLITFHVTDKKEDIRKWYKSQTSSEHLAQISTKLGLRYDRVLVKNQTSRWARTPRIRI